MSITNELKKIIETRESELHKLRTAYGILAGLPEPEASTAPPPSVSVEKPEAPTPIKKVDPRPMCDSCDGRMDNYVTKMPSGVNVMHLKCSDCGNERY